MVPIATCHIISTIGGLGAKAKLVRSMKKKIGIGGNGAKELATQRNLLEYGFRAFRCLRH